MKDDPTKIDIRFDPHTQRMRGVAVHGDTPFDVPFISQITDDLYVGGCQNGLILPTNILNVFSMYMWESYRIKHDGVNVTTVEMYDSASRGVDMEAVKEIAAKVNEARKTGPTLVHCQAGLNRSNLVAATALMLEGGRTVGETIALLREKRHRAVLCNKAFERALYDEFGR